MSLVFPDDYGAANSTTIPMIGFGASKIMTGSGIGNIIPGTPTEWVWLPIPPEGVSTSYQQGWEETTQGAMQMGAEKLAKGVGNTIGGWLGADDTPAAEATNANTLKWDSVKTTGLEALKSKMGMSTGITSRALEQTYVSYSGPSYRPNHSFSFSLRPKSKTDNEIIQKIVLYFKKFSAPIEKGGLKGVMRLYDTPHLFLIQFAPTDLAKSLPKIGGSALTTFDVKYGGDKFNIYESDKRPSQVDISLSFKEMKVLNRSDIEAGY